MDAKKPLGNPQKVHLAVFCKKAGEEGFDQTKLSTYKPSDNGAMVRVDEGSEVSQMKPVLRQGSSSNGVRPINQRIALILSYQ
jgi:hypothetical protein